MTDLPPRDPARLHPTPDFPQQEQTPPGSTGEMRPQPDHGEASYRGSGRLQDRKCVVTGGDSGIGRAVCLAYAREGADVLFTYLPEEEKDAHVTQQHIEEAGRAALPVACDLQSEEACHEVVTRAAETFGRIDVLVNNAAYQMAQPQGLEGISTEQLERVMRTNLYAMFWLCKKALPHIPDGGCILNSTSVQGYKPSAHLLDYAMTKGGIITFTHALSGDLVQRGIRVNAVAPGPVWTPLIPSTLPDTSEFGKQSPLQRPAQPAEMAPAYVFLASQDASYVTGEILNATGGIPLP